MIRFFFFIFLTALPLKAEELKVCDPENTAFFFKRCGEVPDQSRPGLRKIPLWQGTSHQGYQLLDCKKGTIKNVIEKSGEFYTCRIPVNN